MQFLIFSSGCILGLVCFLLIVSYGLGGKQKISREKASPFECGFDSFEGGRISFSVRFFMIAVIFLIFDVEIALLLPLMVEMKGSLMGVWAVIGVVFLLVLIMGTFFEWKEGALDWKT